MTFNLRNFWISSCMFHMIFLYENHWVVTRIYGKILQILWQNALIKEEEGDERRLKKI